MRSSRYTRPILLFLNVLLFCVVSQAEDSSTLVSQGITCGGHNNIVWVGMAPVTVNIKPGKSVFITVELPKSDITDITYHVFVNSTAASAKLLGRASLSINSKVIHETFQGVGIILVYGDALDSSESFGCLELRLDDRSSGGQFAVSVDSTVFKWSYVAMMLTVCSIVIVVVVLALSKLPSRANMSLTAMFQPLLTAKVLPFFVVLEIVTLAPGLITSISTYKTDFVLNGNQDACNFNFESFIAAGNIPQMESMISHMAYVTSAIIMHVLWNLQQLTRGCSVCKDTDCWHWQLGHLISVGTFFLALRSAGYHHCPLFWTAALDMSGQMACVTVLIVLLRQQRRIWDLAFKQVCCLIAYMTAFQYATSILQDRAWFQCFFTINVVAFYVVELFPLLNRWYAGRALKFSNATNVTYTAHAQKIAALAEVILSLACIGSLLLLSLLGDQDFGMSLNLMVYSIGFAMLIVETILRLSYGTLSLRAKAAVAIFVVCLVCGVKFFDYPNSGYEYTPWLSRSYSGGAAFLIFGYHDLWHFASAGILLGGVSLAMFFTDCDEESSVPERLELLGSRKSIYTIQGAHISFSTYSTSSRD